MKLTMNERGAVIKGFAQQYRRAGKKRKGRILDQMVEATGYNRRYAARALRGQGRRIFHRGLVLEGDVGAKFGRVRKRVYGEEVKRVLLRLWEMPKVVTFHDPIAKGKP